MASEYINQWIRIEEDGIYLVFGVTKENQLKLFHFSAKPLSEQEEKKLTENETFLQEGFQLVQVNFSGYNRPYEKHGNKHIVTAPGYMLTFVDMKDERNETGRVLTFIQKDEETGARVVTTWQFYQGTSTIRMQSEVTNEGTEVQTLEYISSFYYLGIEKEGEMSSDDKMQLTFAHNGWQKEMNFHTYSFPALGLPQTQPTVYQRTSKTIELTNTGNWSTKSIFRWDICPMKRHVLLSTGRSSIMVPGMQRSVIRMIILSGAEWSYRGTVPLVPESEAR